MKINPKLAFRSKLSKRLTSQHFFFTVTVIKVADQSNYKIKTFYNIFLV